MFNFFCMVFQLEDLWDTGLDSGQSSRAGLNSSMNLWTDSGLDSRLCSGAESTTGLCSGAGFWILELSLNLKQTQERTRELERI